MSCLFYSILFMILFYSSHTPLVGGLAISLRVRGTSLCFVSCHLAAHEGEKYRRKVI